MSSVPLVSIILNCYNGERYLKDAVDSVLSQTYKNWEIIFWDNQSSDQSAKIFNSYNDSRLKYFYAPSHALIYEARNYAIAQADGDFLAFLDVDDWWDAKKLENQVPLFKDNQVGIVCCKSWIFFEESRGRKQLHKKSIPTGWVLSNLVQHYSLIMSSIVLRRTAFDSLSGGFDKTLHILGDMDFMVRLSIEWKLDCSQDHLMFYRMHGENIGQILRDLHAKELQALVDKFEKIYNIYKLPEFYSLKNELTYVQGQRCIIKHNRVKALRCIHDLAWGKFKVKLLVLFFLPRRLLCFLRLVK